MNVPSNIHRVAREGPGEPTPAASERIVSGSGASTTWNAFSDAAGRFHVGHWAAEPGIRTVHYTEDEFCLILEGRVRLDGPDGSVEFGPGEAFVIAAGFLGTWETLEPVIKLYAIAEPAPKRTP
jgi:uncharacterized cupin superfamily protein